MGVVDLLQAVGVGEHHADVLGRVLRQLVQGASDGLVDGAPVGQPGQRVAKRHLLQRLHVQRAGDRTGQDRRERLEVRRLAVLERRLPVAAGRVELAPQGTVDDQRSAQRRGLVERVQQLGLLRVDVGVGQGVGPGAQALHDRPQLGEVLQAVDLGRRPALLGRAELADVDQGADQTGPGLQPADRDRGGSRSPDGPPRRTSRRWSRAVRTGPGHAPSTRGCAASTRRCRSWGPLGWFGPPLVVSALWPTRLRRWRGRP